MTTSDIVRAYTLINLEQGTPAWLEWRSQGLGASDAPTIMGENPWKRAAELLDEKCGKLKSNSNAKMARGSALEPEARRRFEAKVGLSRVNGVRHHLTLHELGLFQGRLGPRGAIVLLEDGCEAFSNISGLSQILFPPGATQMVARLNDG